MLYYYLALLVTSEKNAIYQEKSIKKKEIRVPRSYFPCNQSSVCDFYLS